MSKTMGGLVLLSGGFDSAVAAKLIQSYAPNLVAVHFSQERLVGKQGVEKATALAKALGIKTLFVVDVVPVLKSFSEHCDRHYYFVFMKRIFFRLAEEIARRYQLYFLVTGENLGQVSSQTLSNLSTVAQATTLPIIRPLLSLDKNEIIALSRRFGLYDISVGPELCDALGPEKPATVSSTEKLAAEETKIPLDTLLQDALKGMQPLAL